MGTLYVRPNEFQELREIAALEGILSPSELRDRYASVLALLRLDGRAEGFVELGIGASVTVVVGDPPQTAPAMSSTAASE